MNPKNIFITGATGFVGRHLVPHLLKNGYQLTLAMREIAACPTDWHDDGAIRLVKTGNLETSPNLSDALAGASTVIHLAGLAHVHGSGGGEAEAEFIRANVQATEKLAAAATESKVSTFIHLSSLFAITDNASQAIINDETDLMPSTAYGRSKRMAEPYVRTLSASGVFPISLRPPLVIGADAAGNWGALQRLAATGLPLPFASVRNRRSMIGVGSLVRAISHLCSRRWPLDKAGSYCIADQGAVSLPEIVTELRKGMGMPPRLIPFPPSIFRTLAKLAGQERRAGGMLGNLVVDPSRFRKAFDFQETQGLGASIRESGEFYRRSHNHEVAETEK